MVGSADEQEARHRLGVRRLIALQVPSPAKPLLDGLDNAAKLGLAGSPYPTVGALVDDVVLAVFGDLVDAVDPVRDEASYDALLAAARAEVEQRARDLLLLVGDVLARWRATHKALTGRVELRLLPAMNDLRGQLDRLVRPGFVPGGRASRAGVVPAIPGGDGRTSRPARRRPGPRPPPDGPGRRAPGGVAAPG